MAPNSQFGEWLSIARPRSNIAYRSVVTIQPMVKHSGAAIYNIEICGCSVYVSPRRTGNHCLRFHVSAYGFHVGRLDVFVTSRDDDVIFRLTGDQGPGWRAKAVSLELRSDTDRVSARILYSGGERAPRARESSFARNRCRIIGYGYQVAFRETLYQQYDWSFVGQS